MEGMDNKENINPEDNCSTITPLKSGSNSLLWKSSERTPLSDISHHFCTKPKRVEVSLNLKG